jgi:hypothetical protein
MVTLFVTHSVRDFDAWKIVYDELGEMRKTMDVRGAAVYRDTTDHNKVTVTHQFDNMETALAWANMDGLKEGMMKAGVEGKPEMWFAEEVEQTAY